MSKITENQLTKMYYSIGEVATIFNVNASLIRFWEKEFPSISPKKNKKGNRLFSPKEIMKIDRIYTLVKEQGYTLDGAKKILKEKRSAPVEQESNTIVAKLEQIKAKLLASKVN